MPIRYLRGLQETGKERWDGVMDSNCILLVTTQKKSSLVCLTGANVDDKSDIVWKVLAKDLYVKLFADRGYISQNLFNTFFADGVN